MTPAHLIGSVLERKTSTPRGPNVPIATKGFPTVHHRSKSAFSRAREEAKRAGNGSGIGEQLTRTNEVPIVVNAATPSPPASFDHTLNQSLRASINNDIATPAQGEEEWRERMSVENETRVSKMSEEERERERQEILERFGGNIGDVLAKAKVKRQRDKFGMAASSVEKPKPYNADAQEATSMNSTATSSVPPTAAPSTPPRTPPRTPSRLLHPILLNSPTSPLSTQPSTPSSSRPASRADKKLRFAEPGPSDVFVYESAPTSPKRRALALPPPEEGGEGIVNLGSWKGTVPPPDVSSHDESIPNPSALILPQSDRPEAPDASNTATPEEGTPEDIRRRFFPHLPPTDPALRWIQSNALSSSQFVSDQIRLDLAGRPISLKLRKSLPAHLGLHHHAEGEQAGYTLEDVFLLARSTVAAQRATMLGLLCGLAERISPSSASSTKNTQDALANDEEDIGDEMQQLRTMAPQLRTRILAAGLASLPEAKRTSSVGARAVELLWLCVTQWDTHNESLFGDDVELAIHPVHHQGTNQEEGDKDPAVNIDVKDPLSSLPFEYLFDTFSDLLSSPETLQKETHAHILAILRRLARHSNYIATKIVQTQKLIVRVVQTYLCTPVPPKKGDLLPDPNAIKLLGTLARSSRENTRHLLETTDVLMRFIAIQPPSSPYSSVPLSASLAAHTLELYAIFAQYGLCAQVASTAHEPLSSLLSWSLSSPLDANKLAVRLSFSRAYQAWLTCARDPHATSPEHDLVWSQVAGWGWDTNIEALSSNLSSTEPIHRSLWAEIWHGHAAYLEGTKVNEMRGGEAERGKAITTLRKRFSAEGGDESNVLRAAGSAIQSSLKELIVADEFRIDKIVELSTPANIVLASIRLWLACCPPGLNGPPSDEPFKIPYADLRKLLSDIVIHPVWERVLSSTTDPRVHALCRPLSSLLALYTRLSRHMPWMDRSTWSAESLSVLARLLPGDEDIARELMADIIDSLDDPGLCANFGVPSAAAPVWGNGHAGLRILDPFLVDPFIPVEENYTKLTPFISTSTSLKTATTQRASPISDINFKRQQRHPLPLSRDWPMTPLDHLLRSGESRVWKNLPRGWNSSEVEVVRASLVLACVVRGLLESANLSQALAMNRDETIFGCMKVFMLEHNLPDAEQDEIQVEVYRDPIVGALMRDLLRPFLLASSTLSLASTPHSLTNETGHTDGPLELVSRRYLGSLTPFFQFYTDFVALFADVSFGDPIFSALLIPPLSMRYAHDYRRLLWEEYDRMIPQIVVPLQAVPTGDIREFLWPVEKDGQIFRAYLRALIHGRMDQHAALRYFAVHHVACNIWPDLAVGKEGAPKPTPTEGIALLETLVFQGSINVVRDIVVYHHSGPDGNLLLPPHCFSEDGTWKSQRWSNVKQWGKNGLVERLESLLKN